MRLYALPNQVAGVEIQAEFRVILKFLEQLLCGIVIERDLTRMDFKSKPNTVFAELVQNGTPKANDLVKPVLNHLFGGLREGIHPLPNR